MELCKIGLKETLDKSNKHYFGSTGEIEERGKGMCKDNLLETEVKNTLNVLDSLSSEDRTKLEVAVKTRGTNILVLGKAKTGVTTALCNILDMIGIDERVAVLTREDTRLVTSVSKTESEGLSSQRNLLYVAPPMDVEVSPFVFKFAPFALFIDRLSLFKNSLNTISRGFKSNESSFISSIQLPAGAENSTCNARVNIKAFIAKNFDNRFDIVEGAKILVLGLKRKDGELTAYLEEIQF